MYRLLVVDDDSQQLAIRKLLLETAGHRVAVAEDAAEARRLLEELHPDAMVMDLCLPRLKDGLALIRFVDEQRFALKIIVLSGWVEELSDLPEEKLVAAVLGKPVRSSELLEAISAAVSVPVRSLRSTAS